MQVCILGDQQHCDEAKANNVPYMDVEALKKLNKNKKWVKKLGMYTVSFIPILCWTLPIVRSIFDIHSVLTDGCTLLIWKLSD
jgi:hypothetical protein